jgi:hypothetical protein
MPHKLAEPERMKSQFQLMNRPGSVAPNFKALYKKKAELGQKLMSKRRRDRP